MRRISKIVAWAVWLVALGALLYAAMQSVGITYQYNLTIQANDQAFGQMALFWAALHAANIVIVPGLISILWDKSYRAYAVTVGAMSALFIAVAVFNITSVGVMGRADATGLQAKKERIVRDLRAELKAAEDRINEMGVRQSPAQLEAEMKAEQQNVLWASTKGCTDATAVNSRTYCANWSRLFGQLAGAQEAERQRAKVEEVRKQIAEAERSSSGGGIGADDQAISSILGVEVELARLLRSAVYSTIAEVGLFIFILAIWEIRPSRRNRTSQVNGATESAKSSTNVSDLSFTSSMPATDPPQRHRTRRSRRQAVTLPSAQVLSFPGSTIASRSSAPQSDRRDNPREGNGVCYHVAGTAALAIVSEPSDASALSPSLSSRDKAHERHPKTIENILLECVERVEGPSESATDITVAVQARCAKDGATVPSQKLIGIALVRLGFKKWKRNGIVRYKDIQLKFA
jgi:hypothetical protein